MSDDGQSGGSTLSAAAVPITDRLAERLAEEINAVHRQISSPTKDMLGYAIRCGELLLQAQGEVPKGLWVSWMRDHLEMHVTTAFNYMRLARNKEEVLAGNHSGIDPALEALSGDVRLSDEAKQEMIRLYDHGKGETLEEIAAQFGVKKSTVWYWVSAKSRNRTKRLQRQQREQGRRALERERERKAMRKYGGPVARAYSLVRQAEQQLDHGISGEVNVDERTHLLEALSNLYVAEQEMNRARVEMGDSIADTQRLLSQIRKGLEKRRENERVRLREALSALYAAEDEMGKAIRS